jgi:hypothetical protein
LFGILFFSSNSAENLLLLETIGELKRQTVLALSLKWDVSLHLADFIAQFARLVDALHQEIATVLPNRERVHMLVKSLGTCAYTSEDFGRVIGDIQATIALFPAQKSVSDWIKEVNAQVQSQLSLRLISALELWVAVLQKKHDFNSTESQLIGHDKNTTLSIKMQYHDIVNAKEGCDSFALEPDVTRSIYALKKQLDEWIDVVVSQSQIVSSQDTCALSNGCLLEAVPSELLVAANAFLAYEKEVDRFVQSWVPHLTLWNARIRSVAR